MSDEIRLEVVHALFDATQDPDLGDEITVQMLLDATPAERQAVSDLHGALADLSVSRAAGLAYAVQALGPHWRLDRPLGAVLKTAPAEVAEKVVEVLYQTGWSASDGLPPRPGAAADEDP